MVLLKKRTQGTNHTQITNEREQLAFTVFMHAFINELPLVHWRVMDGKKHFFSNSIIHI